MAWLAHKLSNTYGAKGAEAAAGLNPPSKVRTLIIPISDGVTRRLRSTDGLVLGCPPCALILRQNRAGFHRPYQIIDTHTCPNSMGWFDLSRRWPRIPAHCGSPARNNSAAKIEPWGFGVLIDRLLWLRMAVIDSRCNQAYWSRNRTQLQIPTS